MPAPRIAVVIPTFNEVGNVPRLVPLLCAVDGVEAVWVMDDGSRDGTLEALAALAPAYPALRVIRRDGPRGYGRAAVEGLLRAAAEGADVVVQMDGDLSHDPRYLPDLLAALEQADLALGSRYLHGVSVVNWPLRRLFLSTAANAYVRLLAGLPVRDCTTGYRAWRAGLLARLRLEEVTSDGYSFLVETLFRARRQGARIVEVPIIFVERKAGASKLDSGVFLESALLPWKLLLRRLLDAIARGRHDPS